MNGDAKILSPSVVSTRSKVWDYLELMKPELTSLSVLTALCGYYLATTGDFDLWRFFHTAIGTALVGSGGGALNEYIEREYDALMRRTERRPLPSGRLAPIEGLLFGSVITVLGILELVFFTNLLTGLLALMTFVLYVFVYTPLKQVTPMSTFVGGIPGALPPVMGWTAVRNEITIEAWVLFAILFCWQIPHFLSLAWMYRKDYTRAGFKMLTVVDERGIRTARHILIYCIALIPTSSVASVVGLSGSLYLVGSIVLGCSFLYISIMFARSLSSRFTPELAKANHYSRRIFFASLFYLPLLFLFMTLDKV